MTPSIPIPDSCLNIHRLTRTRTLIQTSLGFWRRVVATREHKRNHAVHCLLELIKMMLDSSVWHSPEMSLTWSPWPNNGTFVEQQQRLDPSLPRQQSAMLFHHHGWRICGKTFQKLHGIGMIAIIIKGVGVHVEYHNSHLIPSCLHAPCALTTHLTYTE